MDDLHEIFSWKKKKTKKKNKKKKKAISELCLQQLCNLRVSVWFSPEFVVNLISELSAEVRSLKKDKASLEDQVREIRVDTERKLKQQAESSRETQIAEEKLLQVVYIKHVSVFWKASLEYNLL